MSFTDDFLKGLEKRNVKQSWTKQNDYSQYDDYTRDFLTSLEKRKKKKEEEEEANLVEDIAPVRDDRGKADLLGLDLVQSGTFSDGYQFGDVSKAILGTAGDVGLELFKGVGGLAEGIVDATAYLIAGGAELFGEDDVAQGLRKAASMGQMEQLTGGADDWLEQYSIAGNTVDAVAQGVGQVATLAATGGLASTGLGATLLTTGMMGVSGVGSGISEAYEGGADDDEALTYGLISGAADAFTEMIFGGLGKSVKALGFGKGLSSADDMLAKAVSSKFKSTVAKNVAEFGIKAGAEGLEEVLAGTLQAIGKKATYMTEEDFNKILEDENLFEQFIVGAITSGIAQAGDVTTANKTGRDFITGLTQNEQTVVDSLYESEIADKDLDKKEKQKIYDQILTKLDKGYIGIEDIERTLGGETYKAYKETSDSEKALKDKLTASQKEYSELKSISWKERSQEQNNRIAELDTEIKNLEAQVKETTANSKLAELKSQLGNEVFNLTKSDTKLQESYREEMRRGQDLELDVEQYKGAAKITAQNLLKGGMNNTNRTHDVVNFLTKLSADKNIVFDVATAQKLADAGLAVDGKQVNGVITKDGIVLNLESSAVLETTVGHEITHALEGTEHYDVLKNAIKEYAELKGVYADKYSSLESIYSKKDAKGNILKDANGNTVWIRDDVDIDSEIVADLVGEYLFTDADFINNLSVNHRNVFQKIYDEIKYLLKIATAGSEEARKLEEVKRAFDKAYKQDAEVDTAEVADNEVKYSIREEAPPKETGIAYKVFFVKDGKLYPPMVANPDGADTPMGVWLNADVGTSAPPSKTGRAQVKAGGKGTQGGGGSLAFRPGWHLGDLPRASQFDRVNPETGKKELFPENFVWAEVEYAKDVDYQEEAMSYGYTENGKFRHAYAGLPRLPENGYYRYRTNPKPDTVPWIITGAMKVNRLLSDAEVNEILAKNGVEPVHRQGGDVGLEKFGIEGDVKYSLTDSEGNQLSKEQSEYFKDSKVVDKNGNLLVMYHGTPNGDFSVFKSGTYFTDNKEYADRYQNPGASSISTGKTASAPKTFAVYLDIKKPFDLNDAEARRIYIEDYIKGGNAIGINPYLSDAEYAKIKTIDWTEGEDLRDFLIENDYDYDGLVLDEGAEGGYGDAVKSRGKSYVVFTPEQVKNVDNANPTSDPDIRFSLSEAVEETKDLVAVHNLQSSELLRTINLGGLPMPSIAVIKAQQGHEQYGDVSLIFPKDTIDPKARKENKVYGGDAWTPTYPRIEYKPNKAVSKRIKDKYYELAEKIGYDAVRPLQRYTDELESALNSDGGEAGMLDRLYADTKMMQVYLEDSGEGKVEPIVKETRTEATEAEKEMNEWFIDRLGEDVIRAFKVPAGVSPFSHRQEFMAQYGDMADNAYRDLLVEKYDFSREEVEGVLDNTDRKDILRFIRNAEMYLRNGGVTVKTETDYDATEKAITAKAKDGYKEWVDNLFKGVEEKSGIRNNVDYFTNSGNRRSWDTLHWENTLENVVKVMKAQDQTGADAFAPSSALFAVANKQYGSIADIKADSNRLGKVTEEEYDALKEEYTSRFAKIADSIKDPGERNPFIATDRAAEEIIDAVRTQKTKSGMLRYMQKWNSRVTESTVDDIVSLVSDVANMPTGYFEAKPQRAVGLDEVGVFVIPNNTDAKLKQELLNRGYSIAEYDPNVEGDRNRVVNQYEEYKFSLSDPNDIAPVDFRKSAKYLMVDKSNAQDFGDIAPTQKRTDAPVAVDDEEIKAETLVDRDSFVVRRAKELYEEITNLKKGVRASKSLGYLLDHGHEWRSIKTALLNIRDNPNQVVNENSAAESVAREMLGREYDEMVYELNEQTDVAENIRTKMKSIQTEIDNNEKLREQANADYDAEIAEVQAKYDAKKNKNTIEANNLLRRIERLHRLKNTNDANYAKRIGDLEARLERMSQPTYKTAVQRRKKQSEYTELMESLVGDTSTWVDKKLGISYKINTLRRNLRDIVRDASGKQDIAKADAIYDELQGNYNRHEAELKRESKRLKQVFVDMKLTSAEDTYAHMLGEFRHNPDSKLTEETVKEYYEQHKKDIDTAKVDKAIEEARKTFDELIARVNERLREQGMKEIPYRQGYFPHFTNPKQGFLAKLFNWKPVDHEIPTSIAGITETFNPERSWQSFNKERKSDITDYSLAQGLDTYIHGSLDWIYHIEDIQKRRAFENHIRYIHSEEGVKARIDAIRNSEELDADEMQDQIDLVYAEANNPLNNFVTDLRAGTNTLAAKKSSMDRALEEKTNRKIYSVMTNLNNRVNANMVVGSISSALTNFIPIVQSWVEVSPMYSLRGMGDTIRSTARDDGIINKSTFLTNRLIEEEKLYKTGWDKASEKAAFLMQAVDSFTSQTVWRSKYLQNISEGMSENEAIHNADQFAENVIAGRSRGNMPTIFDAKNPLTKMFTAFQLEVNNQYGYMFKDAPTDSKNKARLVKGFATMLVGSYLYNALYSSLVGRDAAFDPLSIIEDLLGDLEDEEEEEAIVNLANNVIEEIPFVGSLFGGGRIPLSSALPYSGEYEGLSKLVTDISEENWKNVGKEMLSPLYYLVLPFGGGQVKKTNEGLGMFSEDHPIAGSYTASGNLRFPVEDNFINRMQAALFGQYASQNARDYFDNNRTALKEKQIQEFIDVDIPIRDYWEYREGLSEQKTIEDKFDYIAGLDLPVAKKNILINNIVDREESVDLEGYDDFSTYEEFDFATKNPEKYTVAKAVGGFNSYTTHYKAMNDISADKDENGKSIVGSRKEKIIDYVNSLDIDYGMKIILFKSEYKADDTYNADILEYLNSRDDLTYEEIVTILTELDFTVDGNGNVYWD